MNVSIICPLYNAESYLVNLHRSILNQENVDIESIKYILTESTDNTEDILKRINANYEKIRKEEFSHSLTREKAAIEAEGDIIVFISQDIIIKDEYWLYNLTKDIIADNCEAAFSRQISKSSGIEKYIRNRNYPDKSRVVTKNDIEKLGLMTFFFSDSSSAVRKDIFINLHGYDKKKLMMNEDMYLAYKIIMGNYRIKYCSDSIIIHSHEFTSKQLYERYFNAGIFFADNAYLRKYDFKKSGFDLTKFVLKKILKHKDYKATFKLLPNFGIRFIGMKMGEKYEKARLNR